MKKIRLFFIFVIMIMLSGCYREESTMTINSDKSMDFEIKVLVDDDFSEKEYLNNYEIYDQRKIKIQRINEYNNKIYKITKHYNNIDDISINKDVQVEINKYLDFDFNDSNLFKKEDEYFKDKYTINFVIDTDFIKKNLNNTETKNEFYNIVKDIYEKVLKEYGNKKQEVIYNNDILKINDSVDYRMSVTSSTVNFLEVSNKTYKFRKENVRLDEIKISDVEVLNKDSDAVATFIINLPKKALSHNASRESDNGKTLIWEFDKNGITNRINVTFELDNLENYYTVIGLFLLSIISFSVLLVITNK